MILKLNILVFTAVAAAMDLKWWKVRNLWILAGIAGGMLYQFFSEESPGIAQGIIGMILPAVLLGFFWYSGLIGAGDVKLFSAVGLWIGGVLILEFMLFSLLSGAVYFFILAAAGRPVNELLKKRIHIAVCAFISALCLTGGIYG